MDAMLSSIWNSVRRLGQSTLTTFALLSLASTSVVTSNVEGIPMLFQDRPIVREWRSLLQIETKVTQIAYFLGKTTNLLSSIQDVSGLQNIVLKYQADGLFVGYVAREGVSYLNILSDLVKMNAGMKYFIAFGSVGPLEAFSYTSLFQVSFSPEALQELKEYYKPVRFAYGKSPCNATFKKMGSSMKQAFSANISAVNESISIISEANKRLVDALAHSVGISTPRDKERPLAEKYFTERELQQLRTVYGINTTKMTNKDAINLKNLLQIGSNIKTSWNSSLRKTKTFFDDAKNTGQEVWGMGVGFYNRIGGFVRNYNDAKLQVENARNTLSVRESNSVARTSLFGAVSLSDDDRKIFFTRIGSRYNEYFEDNLHEAFAASF